MSKYCAARHPPITHNQTLNHIHSMYNSQSSNSRQSVIVFTLAYRCVCLRSLHLKCSANSQAQCGNPLRMRFGGTIHIHTCRTHTYTHRTGCSPANSYTLNTSIRRMRDHRTGWPEYCRSSEPSLIIRFAPAAILPIKMQHLRECDAARATRHDYGILCT